VIGSESIPETVLARGVAGVNLSPGTLADQLGPDPTLLVFLRHFGCMFCRETLADMRAAAESDPDFPRPLFFFQGTTTEGRAFLRRYWPTLRAVADPDGVFYEAFGVGRGSLMEMFGPRVWSAKSRAEALGHRNGPRTGDVFRMPGAFLVQGAQILWAHEVRHAGDRPDYDRIRDVAIAACGALA
jgi:hypothetical protein